MEHDFNTTQTDWEEEVKKIRWYWPHIKRDDIEKAVMLGIGIDPKYVVDFVIPFEYRKRTKEELEFTHQHILLSYQVPEVFYQIHYADRVPEVFYQIHYADGLVAIKSSAASVFISSYKPQKE